MRIFEEAWRGCVCCARARQGDAADHTTRRDGPDRTIRASASGKDAGITEDGRSTKPNSTTNRGEEARRDTISPLLWQPSTTRGEGKERAWLTEQAATEYGGAFAMLRWRIAHWDKQHAMTLLVRIRRHR